MRLHKCFHTGVILAVCAGMLAAGTAQAEGPRTAAAKKPIDVELQAGGGLTGRLVDGHGQALPATRVFLHNGANIIAESQSDVSGNFRFDALRGGVYQLTTPGSTGVYRLWANQTAPPGSAGAVVVAGQDVVAGQWSPMKYWLADPLVIGGVIAVGAGVPIILANQNKDNGSGS